MQGERDTVDCLDLSNDATQQSSLEREVLLQVPHFQEHLLGLLIPLGSTGDTLRLLG
jgi:hypothetical protein